MESELYVIHSIFVTDFMINNHEPKNATKMENSYVKTFKNMTINGLVVMLAVGGLTSSSCDDDKKTCVKEVTTYLPNSKGCSQPATHVLVTLGENEVCPEATIKTAHTPESYTCDQ